eukprot:7026892-Alexandrium_andersonii.AAC.1
MPPCQEKETPWRCPAPAQASQRLPPAACSYGWTSPCGRSRPSPTRAATARSAASAAAPR